MQQAHDALKAVLNTPHGQVRHNLVRSIQTTVKARGISQAAGAQQCGFARTRFTRLMGKSAITIFSLDALIDIASRMQIPVAIQVTEDDPGDAAQCELAL